MKTYAAASLDAAVFARTGRMDSVNQTLYIPLYGKVYVSKKGVILRDEKAAEIWETEKFPLKGKSASKWLAYYMGMRAAVFDDWLRLRMREEKDALILHLGCGMDSRIHRVGAGEHSWYDVDFPQVMEERKRYYQESPSYRMLGADIREKRWLDQLPQKDCAIVVMEGVSMYLAPAELRGLLAALGERFSRVNLLMDCYTVFAAKASRYKNPINDVGVTQVYGMDRPADLEENTGLRFVKEHEMTPAVLVDQLAGMEKRIFQKVFAGKMSKKMYRLYEYQK